VEQRLVTTFYQHQLVLDQCKTHSLFEFHKFHRIPQDYDAHVSCCSAFYASYLVRCVSLYSLHHAAYHSMLPVQTWNVGIHFLIVGSSYLAVDVFALTHKLV